MFYLKDLKEFSFEFITDDFITTIKTVTSLFEKKWEKNPPPPWQLQNGRKYILINHWELVKILS